MREVTLPSGAKLRVNAAPFAESKALYHAVMRELKTTDISSGQEVATLVKNLGASLISSPEVDAALLVCAARSLYNGKSVQESLFEDEKAREDYVAVIMEVAEENLHPFSKALYAQFAALPERYRSFLA